LSGQRQTIGWPTANWTRRSSPPAAGIDLTDDDLLATLLDLKLKHAAEEK